MHADYQKANESSREEIDATIEVHRIMGPEQKFAEAAKQITEPRERTPFSRGSSVPGH